MTYSIQPKWFVVVAIVGLALASGCSGDSAGTVDDAAAHRDWQAGRLEELRAEDGWLAVVGLAWLQEGEQTIGWASTGDDAPDITLPEAPVDAPTVLATIRVEDTASGLRASIATRDCDDCRLTSGSAEASPAADGVWSPFSAPPGEPPITLHTGSFELFAIERGGRLALRVRNRSSPRRESLVAIPTHDYAAGWIIEGRFEPAEGVRELAIDNSTDHDYPQRSLGRFLFDRDGASFAMELVGSDPEVPQLLMVGDASNGDTTYGGGRYLYVDIEPGGRMRADFNRLYNPPCVFTPWATCPLPPPSNRLPFVVPVGEQEPVFRSGAK